MREYRVVDGSLNLEDSINAAAREGFRPVLMTADGAGRVTVVMERNRSEVPSRPVPQELKKLKESTMDKWIQDGQS